MTNKENQKQQSPTSITEELQRLAEQSYKDSRAGIVGWRLNDTIKYMNELCSPPLITFLQGVIMDSFDADYLHNAQNDKNAQWFIDTYIDADKNMITAAECLLQCWKKLTNAKLADRGAVRLGAIWSLPDPYSDICDAMFDDIVCLSRLEFYYLRSTVLVDESYDDSTITVPSKLHSFIDIADVLL